MVLDVPTRPGLFSSAFFTVLFSRMFYAGLGYLQCPGPGEGLEAAVVAFLNLVRETAAGQLLTR